MTSSDQTDDETNDAIPHHSGLANQLRGLWTTVIAVSDQAADRLRQALTAYFSGNAS